MEMLGKSKTLEMKHERVHWDETFYMKQRSTIYFCLGWRFAPQSGERHQKSNAFLVCKNENETKKNIRKIIVRKIQSKI